MGQLNTEQIKTTLFRYWLPIIIGFIVTSLIVIQWFGLFRLSSTLDAFEAAPKNSAILLEFKDLKQTQEKLKTTSYASSLSELLFAKKINEDLTLLDSLISKDEYHKDLLSKSRMVAAAQVNGAKNFDFLYIFDQHEKAISIKQLIAKNEGITHKTSTFKGHTIYELSFPNGQNITLCYDRGLLLAGRFPFLVEYAVEQITDLSDNLTRTSSFNKANNLTGKNSDFGVYLNFEYLPFFLSLFINVDKQEDFNGLQQLASWLSIDVQLLEGNVLLSGYLQNAAESNLFNALKSVKPADKTLIDNVLPNHTAMMTYLGVNNFEDFYKQVNPENSDYFNHFFVPWIGQEFAYVITEPTNENYDVDKFLVAQMKDEKMAAEMLLDFGNQSGELEEQTHQNYTIRRIMCEDLLTPIFGKSFNGLSNPYYTLIDNYVVFANSFASLQLWIDKYNAGLTLARQESYLIVKEKLAETSRLYLFVNPKAIAQIVKAYAKEEVSTMLMDNLNALGVIKPLNMQFIPYSGMFLTNSYLPHTQSSSEHTSILWKTHLEASAAIAPKIVKNHNNGESEILVQDKNNKLYLLNRAGEVLWSKVLDGKIISDIHQIDFYKNDKLQYLFNTSGKIYLIDRNGKAVSGFPHNINSPASNGIAVFDYNGQKNYRFFVACKNGNIYGFEKNGKPLMGWNPLTSNTAIPFPMQHFLGNKKDYLMALSSTGKLLTYKRDGTTRMASVRLGAKVNSAFSYQLTESPKGIVAVDVKGNISHITLEGKRTKERSKVGNNSNVKFAYADIIGSKSKDYALLNEKTVALYFYNKKKKFAKFFNVELEEKQNDIFSVQLTGAEKANIGTVSKDRNRVYLLNEKGELLPDFPLAGTTRFEIVDLLEDRSNVLVVANDDVIYAYKLL